MEELGGLLDQVNKEWKKIDSRVVDHILRSHPPVSASVSNISRRIGGFSWSTGPSSMTVSGAINWISVHFNCPRPFTNLDVVYI